MSKEKNLTFESIGVYATEGTAGCHAEGHMVKHVGTAWNGRDNGEIRFAKCTSGVGDYIIGPAIDRLHEFEKLGMEPEEISNMKEECEKRKGIRQANFVLGEINNDLHRELKKLREENLKLGEIISSNCDYQNKLKDKIKDLERSQMYSWKDIAENLQVTIDHLREENEKLEAKLSVNSIFGLEQEIKRLQGENNRLREEAFRSDRHAEACKTSVNQLYKIIDEKERNIKGLESTIETLEEKLERIDCILTEDDDQA